MANTDEPAAPTPEGGANICQTLTEVRDDTALVQLLSASPIGASITAMDGRWLYINPVLRELLGLPSDDLPEIALRQLYRRPEQFDRHRQLLNADRPILNLEVGLAHQTGTDLWVRLSHQKLSFRDEQAVLSWFVDLTREREAFNELDKQRAYYQALIVQSAEGISLLGAEADILYESPANKRILGYDPMAMYRKSFYNLVHPDDRTAVQKRFRQLLDKPGGMVSIEARFLHRDGGWRVLQCTLRNALADPNTSGIVNNFRDISEQRAMEDRLRHLATRDDLTGVWNRRSFMEQSARELERLHRYQVALSLLLLDVDHFKQINDTHGHGKGDEVLRQMGATLNALLRKSDIAGRIGGEEFAVAMPDTPLHGAIAFAQRLRHTLENLVIETLEGPLRVTASIGVTACETADQSIDIALQRADQAMYLAKRQGRNRVEVKPPGATLPPP